MKRKVLIVLMVACLAMGVLAAAPASASHGANGTVCMVLDPGSAEDGGFNAGAVSGLEMAGRKLHVEARIAESETPEDIVANLDAFVTSGDCDLIIGVGFLVGDEMAPFAADHPDQRFAVIDGFLPSDNVATVLFDVSEAAFLAGYIAAGVSETGKIGTYGGLPIPPVTDFMNGYALGADYYNAQYGAAVEVLGWDVAAQSGLFSFDFGDPDAGYSLGESLMDQGADAVFPVAGFTGFGTWEAVQERKAAGGDVRFVGVDIDAYEVYGDPERAVLTSVQKNTDVAVYLQVEAVVTGTWIGGIVFEGLASGGVDIAPFHKQQPDVPGHLKNDLKAIRAGIVDGSIPTLP
jgi:basic membrane protein A